MVVLFPPMTDWTASDHAAIENARRALEAREALKTPRAREPVGVTFGDSDDGAPWAMLFMGPEEAPTFSFSVHRVRGKVAVLSDEGQVLAVARTVSTAIRDGIGIEC